MELRTNPVDFTEKEIKKRVEEYYSTGYSVKEYCFANGDIDEITLEGWIQRYPLDGMQGEQDDEDAFIIVNPTLEREKRGPKRQLPQAETAPTPFAVIGDIVLYQVVPASYLKSLAS